MGDMMSTRTTLKDIDLSTKASRLELSEEVTEIYDNEGHFLFTTEHLLKMLDPDNWSESHCMRCGQLNKASVAISRTIREGRRPAKIVSFACGPCFNIYTAAGWDPGMVFGESPAEAS
jgi:hypothetical protein